MDNFTNIASADAKVELQKFLSLSCDLDYPLEMWSPAVDRVWHEMLDSQEYSDFSNHACGEIIDHTEQMGFGEISWIPEYRARYGELPPVWFLDADGRLREKILDDYRRTKIVRASWDCTPARVQRKKRRTDTEEDIPSDQKPKPSDSDEDTTAPDRES